MGSTLRFIPKLVSRELYYRNRSRPSDASPKLIEQPPRNDTAALKLKCQFRNEVTMEYQIARANIGEIFIIFVGRNVTFHWRSILTREMELERVDGMSKSYKMVHNELVTTLTETIRVVVVPNAPSRNEKSNSLGLRLGRGEKAMPLIYGPIFTRWTRVN